MSKKGESRTTLYVIFILIAALLLLFLLYKIIQLKVLGGIFKII